MFYEYRKTDFFLYQKGTPVNEIPKCPIPIETCAPFSLKGSRNF